MTKNIPVYSLVLVDEQRHPVVTREWGVIDALDSVEFVNGGILVHDELIDDTRKSVFYPSHSFWAARIVKR